VIMRDILSNESRIVTKTCLILEDSRLLLEDSIFLSSELMTDVLHDLDIHDAFHAMSSLVLLLNKITEKVQVKRTRSNNGDGISWWRRVQCYRRIDGS
jgi:hypothetical protein